MPYLYDDPMYFVVIILGLLSVVASFRVKSTFAKYSKVAARRGMTGVEAATHMLRNNGLNHVQIRQIPGDLTDHYDPRNKSVNLSDSVYAGRSVASIAVACHEVGHAIQDAHAYGPLKFRHMFFPAANIGSRLGLPLFIAGLVFSLGWLQYFGIIFFSAAVLFQLITLPVEFNASQRALAAMENLGIVDAEEVNGAKRVLWAAAMTYVAAAAVSVAHLARLILLSRSRD
ncbi:MAG: zinc metallopeptidase [Bacillota bacterium]|nr:zinc metallopeptidase [Bacillota bacterium]